MRTDHASPDGYRLEDRFLASEGSSFLSGVQALARLPLDQIQADRDAGHRTAALVTGYPGSPLAGFDGEVRRAAALRPDLPIVCRPALNEELAATSIMGAQLASTRVDATYDGVVGFWYGKSPGVDRAADALRHAVFAGTSALGGAVAFVADDPNAKSSTLPSSSVGLLNDLHVPVMYPSDPASVLRLGRHAVELSRYCGLWVALKVVSEVADGTGSMDASTLLVDPVLPPATARATEPFGLLLGGRSVEREREIVELRYELARQYASANDLNAVVVDPPDAWIGIVVSGITANDLRASLRKLGLSTDADVAGAGIRLLEMQMPVPFDPEIVRRFARGLDEVLVIEEKAAHLEDLVISALYRSPHHPVVTGKRDDRGALLVPGHGGLSADALAPVLRRRLSPRVSERLQPELPVRRSIPVAAGPRTPYFCSGCPHNASTQVPSGTVVGAGIGCHTMTLLMEPEQVGDIIGLTPMGNEGAQWIGMAPFVEGDHIVQNIGDGTYFHSGQLAVTAAVAAGVNITYKLLYNGAVAMTGGQHPEGQRSIRDLVEILRRQGVAKVLITTDDVRRYSRGDRPPETEVWPRSRLIEAQEHLARVPGVTVLIHDQACAAELRRARKRGLVETPTRRVAINHRICEGCGDCGRVSNCLSVQPIDTPYGRKTTIDQSSCNLDVSCLGGDCPSFLTVDTKPSARRHRRRSAAAPSPPSASRPVQRVLSIDVPEPTPSVSDEDFALRITGIGGTGVVTVAQVIGTAAMLGGLHVRGLDQVGLSQKAGPVVSDLQLARRHLPASNRVGADEADLILALDQLVASMPSTLEVASRDRTAVVGSTTVTPTGRSVRHPDLPTPTVTELQEAIGARTMSERQLWADLGAVAETFLGSTLFANTIAIGMAVQSGLLPLSPGLVERAIRLNGASVDANLDAFAVGRRLAHARSEVVALIGGGGDDAPPIPAALERALSEVPRSTVPLVRRLSGDLVGYQDLELALNFVAVVARAGVAEDAVAPGSTVLTQAVAVNLHRVLAYKDEYEVARLLLDDSGRQAAAGLAEHGGTIRYHLHPPVLRALGYSRKIAVGAWTDPAWRALAMGKRLRGTRLDPFGRTAMRRLERDLVTEYEATVDVVLGGLSTDRLPIAVALCELPDQVRGFEDLKVQRVGEMRQHRDRLLAEYRSRPGPTRRPPG